jgi:hypothetical protein
MNYAYLLLCADGSLYAGWTNDLRHRLSAHNDGSGAKYTRARRPVKFVYAEAFERKEDAQKREYEIKKMRRSERLSLVRGGERRADMAALLEEINREDAEQRRILNDGKEGHADGGRVQ